MSSGDADRLARVAINQLAEPGDPAVASLVAELGAARLYDLLRTPASGEPLTLDFAARLAGVDAARELERAARRAIRFVVPGDQEWPSSLDDLARCESANQRGGVPVGLWVRGPVTLDALEDAVAMVGSRSATGYGETIASRFSTELATADRVVVSGAAFGIDQAAHRGALAAGGITAAVLACGVDRCYPTAHRDLIEHLGSHGVVISEAPLGAAPMRVRFLARNRLIAALTRGTVVVEAAARSGALNTARWAAALNRAVMAVPGPVSSATSAGCHGLIRDGAATLVSTSDEVLEQISASGRHLTEPPGAPPRARDALSVHHRQVLDAVPVHQPASAESIARTAGVALVAVRRALDVLTGRGLVQQEAGGWRLTAQARC